MPQYEVGKRWYFDSLSRYVQPGEVIELPEAEAESHMHNEPGLLKPARQTAQATPEVARSAKPKSTKHRAKR